MRRARAASIGSGQMRLRTLPLRKAAALVAQLLNQEVMQDEDAW